MQDNILPMKSKRTLEGDASSFEDELNVRYSSGHRRKADGDEV
jgi:hypothetical protein